MKIVILAGGLGSRLSEETTLRPKPMVEIGGKPLLWHIMNIYAFYGYNEFVLACGYKGELIKEYFSSFVLHNSDLHIDLKTGKQSILNATTPEWKVAVVDTGLETLTGGRLRRLRKWIGNETFMVTYGDGVGNVDIKALVNFHRKHGKKATVTAVIPPPRFGGLELEGDKVSCFTEKPHNTGAWINGGFFVFEPSVLDYIDGDAVSLEREPLERLAADGELMAFRHSGFWHPVDTLRDKHHLENLWNQEAPWKIW